MRAMSQMRDKLIQSHMNFVSWTLQMAVKNSMVSVYETSLTYLTLDSIIGCNLEDVIRFFF